MVSRPNQLELPTPDQPATESATGAEAGSPGRTPNHPNPTESLSQLFQGMTEEQMMLGTVSPHWVPDEEAPHCMICENKFTLVRRRHHCR